MADTQRGDLSHILSLARRARWWIVIGGNSLILFTVLRILFSGFKMPEPELIRTLELTLYLVSWIFGTNFDVTAQRLVYTTNQEHGSAQRSAPAIVLPIIISGAILFSVIKRDKALAVALSIFFISNVYAWKLLVRVIKPVISSSQAAFKDVNIHELNLFNTIIHYLTGNWQWYRFTAMLLTILITDVICFWSGARDFIAAHIHHEFPSWSADVIARLLPALSVGLFMIVGEGWNWLMRLRVYLAKRRMRVSERVREVWSEKDKIVQRNPNLEERVGKSFELQLSWPKYLWAGHAGCLAISVKYLMDHGGKGPLYIQGVGVSILTFALGFVLAVLGYAALTIVRDSVMDGLLLKAPSPSESLKASYKAWIDLGMSICFLLLGIISFVIRYGSF